MKDADIRERCGGDALAEAKGAAAGGVIELAHLTRRFGEKTAVDDLNLTIRRGELLGLLGINGAGKTTTIRMICGLLRPTEGRILVDGQDMWASNGHGKEVWSSDRLAAAKAKINLSPQETAVADNLTVRENLSLMAGLYGAPRREGRAQAEAIIGELHLEEVADRKAKVLSGGWKRRLSIAMALVTEPEILFLDEPTLGLDVIARRSLWETIRQLQQRMTIVLTTHYLEEAEALCDRIAVMVDGRLKALGTAEELKAMAGCDDFEEAFVRLASGACGSVRDAGRLVDDAGGPAGVVGRMAYGASWSASDAGGMVDGAGGAVSDAGGIADDADGSANGDGGKQRQQIKDRQKEEKQKGRENEV